VLPLPPPAPPPPPPAPHVVNLNVPNVELDDVRGVRDAFLAPFGTVRAAIVDAPGGGLQMELAGAGEPDDGDGPPPGSDTALVMGGYATVTSLTGIGSTERPGAAAAVEHRLPARSG
ncbi:MAG: hypothetical protein ACR2JF_13085, partial [Iamia sp.]